MKIIVLFATLFITFTTTQIAFAEPQIKPEMINIEGRLGTINVQRIKSIQSEIRYVPNGVGISYSIINPSDQGTDLQNEHMDSNELSIPSWTLFNW
ncbi:MAG TPA: hypothetical protein ENJ33_04930 [Thiothrix sp.]|nr:hypothetical protein [Thiothrix sp.]